MLNKAELLQCKRLFMAGYRHWDFVVDGRPMEHYEPVVDELMRLEDAQGKLPAVCECGLCVGRRDAMDGVLLEWAL